VATVFTHAALPILGGRGWIPQGLNPRRYLVATVLCSCVADLDFIGYAFDVRPIERWGHRGLSHSIGFAAVLALVAAVGLFPALIRAPRALLRAWLPLFLWSASHGLLDAFTFGDVPVAWLAPFFAGRIQLPYHPVPVIPLGLDEALSRWGALILINELLLIVIPSVLISRLFAREWRQSAIGAIAWVAIVGVLKLQLPDQFAPAQTREFRGFNADEDPALIPHQGRLVTRLDELRALNLFNVDLEPDAEPWSSGFFPAWYGGLAGRWQDSRFTLVGRTLAGFEPPSGVQADALLKSDPAALMGLSPLEKYDLATGDRDFQATREELKSTHNRVPHPRFWFGLCNGVAAAALFRPEPFRTVDVIGLDGQRVRFHPNDVKALLAAAFAWPEEIIELGGVCHGVSVDPGKTCSMNPASVVLAALNRIGRERGSFLVDVHPSLQAQYYAVARARVDLRGEPYVSSGAQRVDLEIRFEVSSTTLSAQTGNLLSSPADPTRYQKVGLRPITFVWFATLQLDQTGGIVGGRWTGDPPDGPDSIAFLSGPPRLTKEGALVFNDHLRWAIVDAIARASVDDEAVSPEVDLRR
jgi:inner membrane protein